MEHIIIFACFFFVSLFFSSTNRDFRPTSLEKGQEKVRLRIYKIYSWGIPFIIATVAAVIDNMPSLSDHFLRPKFAVVRCWFAGKLQQFNLNAFLSSSLSSFIDL